MVGTLERPALASLRLPPPRLKRLPLRALLLLRLRFVGRGRRVWLLLLLPHWLSVRCGMGA